MEKVIKPARIKGFQKGVSGNINGRPIGSKNVIPNELKLKVQSYLNDGFNKFVEDMEKIEDVGLRCKLYLEAYKTVMPKPRDEEEIEEEKKISDEFMRRLFPDRYRDSE